MSRSNRNGPPGTKAPAFDFQIAPESGVFQSQQTKYRITFRHTNCAEYDGRAASNPSAPPPRADDSHTTEVDILTGSIDVDHPEAGRWMQVCPGGCNEKTKGQDSGFDAGIYDDVRGSDDIAAQLYEKALGVCRTAHPQGAEVLEVFDTRIVWAKNSPKPAYLSPSQLTIVQHSTAVTSGHLALVQARGNIDKIGLGFRTYDHRRGKQADRSLSVEIMSARPRRPSVEMMGVRPIKKTRNVK
ncbi:hypothetical protein F5B17DRAFT_339537 [Nemania serpens]|nr:hypothetical protein F5B17DRAFT_339537 [Nemania serpens]